MKNSIRIHYKPLQGDPAAEPRRNPITLGEALKQAIQRRNAQPPPAELDEEALAAVADMVVAKLRPVKVGPGNFGEALKRAIQK